MSSIDERVVNMKFNNSEFQQGVKATLDSLAQLQKGLQLQGASKGLTDVQTAASKFSLGHIGASVDAIRNKLRNMSVVGIAAINALTAHAVNSGIAIGKAFTVGPIAAGFENYETQINAIQTILANTGLKGKQGLQQVNGVLKQLNTYANQTVYNFSEMVKNIGTFTAAGVKLKPAANAIKGIANLAALSGSNSNQASMAMYQLSQAIAANQVHLQDWNSVVNAGLGGKVFQNALYNTGLALHTIKNAKVGESFEQWTKAGNTFRQSLQSGWVTGKVLTQTLEGFTGDLSAAQLKAMGYTQAQIKQIREMGTTAVNAATKIKTITQLSQALKEEVATAYAAIFKTIFGNIKQATALFSKVHIAVENALTGPIYAFNKVLQGWAKLGGRNLLIEGLVNGLHALESVIKPIHDAFREIFPAQTAQSLLSMTQSFSNLMANLKIGADTANNLKHTFAGLFAVLDIGWQVIKAGAKFIADLFGAVTKGEGSGGFLQATGNIGDFLVALDQAIKKGGVLTKFFNGLEKVLAGPIALIKALAGAIFSLFSFKAPDANGIAKAFNPIEKSGHLLTTVWGQLIGILKAVFHFFEPLAQKFADFFSHIGDAISQGFGGINFADVLHTIDTGLFAAVIIMIHKFVQRFRKTSTPFAGLIDAIRQPFISLTETLEEMQRTLQAATLLQIAAAIGIMSLSIIGISKIDPQALSRALGAISVMFGQLFGSLMLFNRIGGIEGMVTAATGLTVLAVAIRVLTSSVVKLSTLDWGQLSKGLVGVTALIAALAAATHVMSFETAGMVRTGAGLILLATGIRVLVLSVTKLSGLSWGQMAKGLTGVAVLLGSLALYTKFADADAGGVLAGAGIILLATGIKILATAVADISKLSWGQLVKGLVGLAGALVGIGAALNLIPPSSVLSAAGILVVATSLGMITKALGTMGQQSWGGIAKSLVTLAGALVLIGAAISAIPPTSIISAGAILIVSAALGSIAKALGNMGGMSWGEIAKGLTTLAGSLVIIAGAMVLMTGALPGAAALLVISASLAVMAPILKTLGGMNWGSIAKGLATLAGVFVILGVAGLVLTPLVPTLLGLGAAITLLGGGVALAGVGVAAFATGLATLAVSGTAAAASVVAFVSGLLGLLPTLGKELALMIISFSQTIATAGPAIIQALVAVLDSLITAIHREGPKIINVFFLLMQDLLKKAQQNVPKMAREALNMMVGVLNAIKRKGPQIFNAVADIIIEMLQTFAKNAGRFSAAAANLIANFIEGIAKNMGKIIHSGVDLIIAFVKGIGQNAVRIANAALDTIVQFINGIADAIETHVGALRDAGMHMAFAIIDGMTLGLASKAKHVVKGAVGLASSALHGAGSFLGIGSPSKEFEKLGRWCAIGLANGLVGGKDEVKAAWQTTHDLLHNAIQDTAQDISDFRQKIKDLSKDHAKNADEIAKYTKKLNEALKEHEAVKGALDELNKKYSDEEAHLERLGKKYDEYSKKLEKANQDLQNAKQVRDDYNQSVQDTFNITPDVQADTTLSEFVNSDKEQLASLKKMIEVLAKLRAKGLSDAMYMLLLSKGTAALPLAEQILAGGQKSINQVNGLTDDIAKAAAKLGSTASKSLYQAGVNAAQGVVDGLKKKRNDIKKEMEAIADEIVKALKKSLKIKSPSKVMHGLGEFVTQGLANGIKNAVPQVEKATSLVGKNAIDSMKKSIAAVSNAVSDNMNLTPTIAPVLDLSAVKKGAAEIDATLTPSAISVGDTYSKAKYASAGYQANRTATTSDSEIPVQAPRSITFIQNNTSPKALSSAEIYRQTKNQLSVVKKGALTDNAA